jgi:uncharacterized protein (TIGR03083 family)
MSDIEALPILPSTVIDGAVAELEHVTRLVGHLSRRDWSRRSAVEAWTIGDVVAHLDLFLAMYRRMFGTIAAGAGSTRVAKSLGWLTGSMMPSAAPIFNAINGVIPRLMGRILSPDVVKQQFATNARKAREHFLELTPEDYFRPVYYEGGPYPFSFYLAIVINELAIHAWDIESKIQSSADLSEHARQILPWFYWSGARLMLRPRKGIRGTVQVRLSGPVSAMGWSVTNGCIKLGRESTCHPDARIEGPAGAYLLTLAGRLKPAEVMQSILTVDGDHRLAEQFLGSWHLI